MQRIFLMNNNLKIGDLVVAPWSGYFVIDSFNQDNTINLIWMYRENGKKANRVKRRCHISICKKAKTVLPNTIKELKEKVSRLEIL